MTPAEEIALMPPAGSGPRESVESLFRRHYGRLVSLLARVTGDPAQAEELAADVFCKLARPGAPHAESAPWLYRVALNAGLDALRSNTRRRRREEAAGAESLRTASGPTALDSLLAEERRERVRGILAEMKPRDAQLLLLRAEGLPYKELAAAVGVQPSSVGTLLVRAEAEFARRYRERYGEDL
ncbi:MAG TPA: sigma-70 family RNA polymerase sigma factor [Bryobacteraceae bacterium]|nr:sigma-70 family RNA polymerase sigma factor [Bryobacteraceae bacterium]